jgi:ABC-type transporter MlaC component
MNRTVLLSALIMIAILPYGCDSKSDTVSQGRKAVKEVVTQPFNTLDSAKDSLKQSEDKAKAALEQADKEAQ